MLRASMTDSPLYRCEERGDPMIEDPAGLAKSSLVKSSLAKSSIALFCL
jgi:hypothetical protein